MKVNFLVFFALFITSCAVFGEGRTMKWLRSGCIGFEKVFSGDGVPTKQDFENVMRLGFYLQGFIDSTKMHSYSSGGSIEKFPAKWEKDSLTPVTKSILSYINEFEQKYKLRIPDDFDMGPFIWNWYSVKHPKSLATKSWAFEMAFLNSYFPEVYERIQKEKKEGKQ